MKKKILAVCLAAAACVLLSTTIQTKSMQRNMAQKVLRFHVLANSDSREDQALKLKVRDQVGTLMAEKLKDADSLEESERIVKANLNLIENCAADVISAEGYAYPVSAALENCTFPEKTYGTYTFPGGVYEALRVVIGSGEGHNWWCVMYPNLCFANSMDITRLQLLYRSYRRRSCSPWNIEGRHERYYLPPRRNPGEDQD